MSSLCWIDPNDQGRLVEPRQKPQRLVKSERTFSENPASSIPTKYATVIFPRDEKKGFSSTASRFDDPQYLPNDAPGPGAYRPTDLSSTVTTISQSSKGTGNFPSQVQRFPHAKDHQVSPASYNPDESWRHLSRRDHSRAPCSRPFHMEAVRPSTARRNRHAPPPPNKYSLPPAPSQPLPAAASFKSRSRRETFQLPTAANPSPGQYDVRLDATKPETHGHHNLFRSSVKRNLFRPPALKTPGPGSYDSHINVHMQRPAYTQTHYLCLTAPAIPPPRSPSPPGPTAYNLQERSSFTLPEKKRPDPSFKSNTGRWTAKTVKNTDQELGPGTYHPSRPVKQSFLLNKSSKWI